MTPPLLEHELVRKYFGCNHGADCNCTAENVLQAMTAEINQGDLVLERFPSNPDNEWQLMKAPQDFDNDIHAGWLKLPDSFQPPPERECKCLKDMCPEHGAKPSIPDTYGGDVPKPPSTAGCQCELDHRIMEHCRYECQCVCHAKPTPAPSAVEEKIKELSERWWNGIHRDRVDEDLCELVALVRQEGK